MALFKIFKGKKAGLSSKTLTDGWAYFTTDDQKFYVDAKTGLDAEGKPIIERLNVHTDEADVATSYYSKGEGAKDTRLIRELVDYNSTTSNNNNQLGTLTINGTTKNISMPTTTMHLGATFYIGATPPTTARLWIDTNENGFFKYRTEDNGIWKPVPIGWTE